MNNSENLELLEKIKLLVELTSSLKHQYNKIVLYGYGTMGKLLGPLLSENLVAIIDQAPLLESFNDIPVTKPESLATIDYDCIVISVLGREEAISVYLKNELGVSAHIFTVDLSSPLQKIKTPLPIDAYNKLNSLKGKFTGKRCFIIGNGPSLNKCNLSLLNNEYTFGVNGIFYKTNEMSFKPTFYTVEDNHVIDDNLDEIHQVDCAYKFYPFCYQDKIKYTDNVYFFNYDRGFFNHSSPFYCSPRFSTNSAKEVFAGQTVTYSNIQLAYFLGFAKIYLIGVDFSYTIPESTEICGDTYISNEGDPNHFHPDYFGKGKKWHDPKLDRVLLNFMHAKEILRDKGVKIFNATIGGKLEVYPRVNFYDLFN